MAIVYLLNSDLSQAKLANIQTLSFSNKSTKMERATSSMITDALHLYKQPDGIIILTSIRRYVNLKRRADKFECNVQSHILRQEARAGRDYLYLNSIPGWKNKATIIWESQPFGAESCSYCCSSHCIEKNLKKKKWCEAKLHLLKECIQKEVNITTQSEKPNLNKPRTIEIRRERFVAEAECKNKAGETYHKRKVNENKLSEDTQEADLQPTTSRNARLQEKRLKKSVKRSKQAQVEESEAETPRIKLPRHSSHGHLASHGPRPLEVVFPDIARLKLSPIPRPYESRLSRRRNSRQQKQRQTQCLKWCCPDIARLKLSPIPRPHESRLSRRRNSRQQKQRQTQCSPN